MKDALGKKTFIHSQVAKQFARIFKLEDGIKFDELKDALVKKQKPLSWVMQLVETITYGMIILDIFDSALDFAFVAELAKEEATVKHAVWLGCCSTFALLMEVTLKVKIQLKKRAEVGSAPKQAGLGWFDTDTKKGKAAFILFVALMELLIFFVEDATTLFVWWQTGIYLEGAEEASGLSKANLYITVASAVVAVVGLIYAIVRYVQANKIGFELCDPFYVGVLYVPAACICGVLAFWAWFAIAVILNGESYNCIGACNTTAVQDQEAMYASVAETFNLDPNFNAETSAILAQLADYILTTTTSTLLVGGADIVGAGEHVFLDGSGESEAVVLGYDASLYGGNSLALNRGVVAAYAVGWILAVGGILLSVIAMFPSLINS